MKIRIEIDKKRLQQLVQAEIERLAGDIAVEPTKIAIETRSKQNYRAEWEEADYRAVFESVG